MAVSKRLRLVSALGGNSARALMTGLSRARSTLVGTVNNGTADVRGKSKLVQVITLNSFGGTDSFKIRVNSFPRPPAGGTVRRGAVLATDTVAFVRGTNAASTDLQTALRTATGDSTLTVSGTTDAGPFTVTFVGKSKHRQPLFQLVSLSGCSGNVERSALSYDKPPSGLTSGVSQNGIRIDPTSSVGRGGDFPLGQSVKTDGAGQSHARSAPGAGTEIGWGTALAVPTMVSAVGGVGQVVVDTTEDASSGTSGEVLFACMKLAAARIGEFVKCDVTDVAGDPTITGLTAGDYALLYAAVTGAAASGGRVGPTGVEYFTVT